MPIPTMPSSQLIFFSYHMLVFVCECGFTPAVAHVHAMAHIWRSENNFLKSFLSILLRQGLSFLLHILAYKLLSNSPGSTSHVTKCQDCRCIYLYPAFSQGSVSGLQAYIASTFTCWATIVLFCFETGSYFVALAVQELTRPGWPRNQ